MELTPAVYAHLLTSLTALANGKVAVVLEVIHETIILIKYSNYLLSSPPPRTSS